MKPLIIIYLHKIPYPLYTGTNQRIVAMVNFLKEQYQVGLIIPEYHPDIIHLQKIFTYIWYGGNYQGLFGKLHKYVTNKLFSIKLYTIFHNHLQKYSKNPLGKYNIQSAYTLYKVCSSQKPALIISQKVINTVLSIAIAKKFNIPIIIDTHDLYTLQKEGQAQRVIINLKGYDQIKIQDEKELLQLYDALITIQFEEEAILKYHFPDKRIITALHPVISPYLQNTTFHINTNHPTLLFVASASNHNVDAINYFINSQLKYILHHYPSLTLIICGDVGKYITEKHENIQITGRIAELKSLYEKATIVINPVRYGSGLKIKTIDALAYGKCIITTANGAEGLPHINQVLVCTEAEKFGSRIVELLNNRNLIRCYEENAYKYVTQYLNAHSCYRALIQLINTLIKVQL